MPRFTPKLRGCKRILDQYEKELRALLDSTKETAEPQAVCFWRTFAFGRTTMSAMIVLREDNEDYAICTSTLCRPFFEIANRLLWATCVPDGWERLMAYWAKEDRKWANGLVEVKSLVAEAKRFRNQADAVLSRKRADGSAYDPAPGFETILLGIAAAETRDGVLDGHSTPLGKKLYAEVYRSLCRPSHAHISSMADSPETHERIAVGGAQVATLALLRAAIRFVVLPVDVKKTIEEMVGDFLSAVGASVEKGAQPKSGQ